MSAMRWEPRTPTINNIDNRVTTIENGVTNVDARVTDLTNNVTNLGNSIAAGLGGNSSYDPTTGTVTTNLNVGGNTYNSVNDALTAINTTAGAGWNIQANGGPATNVPSNGTLNVTAGSNTVVTLNGNQLQVAMADNPTFTGVVSANGGLAVGANTSVNMGGNVVQNVGAGAVNATSTDAVNGSQLHQVQQVASNSVQYDNGDRNSVTFNPGGAATTLHNIAAGVAPTDAVNVQQLTDGLAGTLARPMPIPIRGWRASNSTCRRRGGMPMPGRPAHWRRRGFPRHSSPAAGCWPSAPAPIRGSPPSPSDSRA